MSPEKLLVFITMNALFICYVKSLPWRILAILKGGPEHIGHLHTDIHTTTGNNVIEKS